MQLPCASLNYGMTTVHHFAGTNVDGSVMTVSLRLA